MINYINLKDIYNARKEHRLNDCCELCDWLRKKLESKGE